MERWQNRVAVVTGASSGIGAACCRYLIKHGMIVVGLARRQERVEEIRHQLETKDEKRRMHVIKCDVRQEAEICEAFAWIEANLGPVAVLINNAGVVRETELVRENNTEELRATLETNVLGVALCTREAFRSMKNDGEDGHVVLVNSVVGHQAVFVPGLSMNIYPASKHAVTAMNEVYRQEFQMFNSKIKITSISPGIVATELFDNSWHETLKDAAKLRSEDIADAILYCLQTPPHVQIHELTIKPMGEMF